MPNQSHLKRKKSLQSNKNLQSNKKFQSNKNLQSNKKKLRLVFEFTSPFERQIFQKLSKKRECLPFHSSDDAESDFDSEFEHQDPVEAKCWMGEDEEFSPPPEKAEQHKNNKIAKKRSKRHRKVNE